MTIAQRIEELRLITDGWFGGYGKPPSRPDLGRLEWRFQSWPDDVPQPNLFPAKNKRISAEWVLGDWSIDLEIDFSGEEMTGNYNALNITTLSECDKRLDLLSFTEWQWLVDEIRRLAVIR